jgi:hypothetical protein
MLRTGSAVLRLCVSRASVAEAKLFQAGPLEQPILLLTGYLVDIVLRGRLVNEGRRRTDVMQVLGIPCMGRQRMGVSE